MNPDSTEPLIDALLDEALGGQSPPDLSSRILAEWSARNIAPKSSEGVRLPLSVLSRVYDSQLTGSQEAEPVPPPMVSVAGRTAPEPLIRLTTRKRRQSSSWLQFNSSIAVVLSVLVLGYFGIQWNARNTSPSSSSIAAKPAEQIAPSHPGTKRPEHSIATPPLATGQKDTTPERVAPDRTLASGEVGSQNIARPNSPNENSPANSNNTTPSDVAKTESDESIVAFINKQLQATWKEHGVVPAPRATDAEFCRRAFLRILGRIPTVNELDSFTRNKSANKAEQLVDTLLDDPKYVPERSQHWASVFANLLVGRAAGTEPGDAASREGLEMYLRNSLEQDKPFNQIALELISATGAGQPGADNFNGAANFLLANADDKGIAAVAKTCRVFLGVQLQCAQCHDHPTEPLTQKQFWSMTAFFQQMKVTHDGNNPAELADHDYLGFDGRDEEGLVFYELPSGVVKAASPEFIDGQSLKSPSGRVSDIRRREELAKLVVESPNFSKAAINRVWSQFLGFGFTKPSESIGAASAPAMPEVFDQLSREFAARNYDLKSAMRWVALSDAFNRSSQMLSSQLADSPDEGTLPLFSRYYTRPLQAEEVFRSLQIAAKLRGESGSDIEKARMTYLAQFAKKNGEEEQLSAPSVIQMNTALTRRAATPGFENLLHGLSSASMKFDEKVEHLFLTAVSRKPTRKEAELARSLAGMNGRNESAALEDIWWALLNSNEFILDH